MFRHLFILLTISLCFVDQVSAEELFDTRERYSDGGTYLAERAEVHQHIVDSTVNAVEPSELPVLILLLGGPGAGKSTIVNQMQNDRWIDFSNFVVANADVLKTKLPEYLPFLNEAPMEAARAVHDESVDIRKKVLLRCAEQSKSVLFESAAIRKTPAAELLAVKQQFFQRYRLVVIHVEAELGTAERRATNRYETSDDPETTRWNSSEQVRAGRKHSRELFEELKPHAHIAIDVDNNQDRSGMIKFLGHHQHESNESHDMDRVAKRFEFPVADPIVNLETFVGQELGVPIANSCQSALRRAG